MSTQAEKIRAQEIAFTACGSRHLISPVELGAMFDQVDDLRAKLTHETARRERAELRLREFCQENPTRWTRLELMEVRNELLNALKRLEKLADTNPYCAIGLAFEHCEPNAREAIAAAEAQAATTEHKNNKP